MDQLPLLKDIHLPKDISLFPSGWGVFVFVFVLFFLIMLYPIFKKIYRQSRKYYALKLLKNIDENTQYCLDEISKLLRRICLVKYQNATTYFGTEWIDFLNAHTKTKIDKDCAKLLIYAPYLPANQKIDRKNFETIKNFALCWVEENL